MALGRLALFARRDRRAGGARRPGRAAPIAVLLLPRALEQFILRDQAEDLLRRQASSPWSPRGCRTARTCGSPRAFADGLAATQARRLKLPGVPRAIVIFHPLQYPLARGLIAAHPDAELWYWRWDRYEAAYDAKPRQRDRLEELHMAASLRAAVNIVVSDALGDLAREEGWRAAARPARRRLLPRARARRRGGRGLARAPRPSHRLGAAARGRRGHAGAGAAAGRRLARGRVRPRPGLPGLPRSAEPGLARAALRRGGGAADPVRGRRDRPVRALGVQRHRRSRTGSSSTPGSAGARSRRT